MTAQNILNPRLRQKFESLRGLLQRSLSLTDRYPDTGDSGILRDRLAHLNSVALFVIVGEVNSGKSSFINALLGQNICEVAPDPCTAVIQELVYGAERKKVTLGDRWERVYLPEPILKEISIVDTPGTNSIIQNHQAITENYVPQSDLIIFVLEATNPHRGTEWELLSKIRKDWYRKTVFVLQMADRASGHELSVNKESVMKYARERNVQNPIVFTVSAKRETEGAPDSGFAQFRQFLSSAVENGDVWLMKLESTRDTVKKIVTTLHDRLKLEEASISGDMALLNELGNKVKRRREKTSELKRLLVNNLSVSYNRLSSIFENDFKEGLSVTNILRRSIPFMRDVDFKSWMEGLQSRFDKEAKAEIEDASKHVSRELSNEIQSMFDDLNSAISHRQEGKKTGGLSLGPDRADILERLQAKLQNIRVSDIIGDKASQASELGSLTLSGGGLAVLGAIIASVFHLVAFDITGGILAAIGTTLVAFTLLWKRPNILRNFSRKLAESQNEFRERFDQEISQIFEKIYLEIEFRLNESDRELKEKAELIRPLMKEAHLIIEDAKLL